MNGMIGCSRRSAPSSTCTSVAFAAARLAADRVRLHARLDQLEVPVGELAPEEVVGALRSLVEPERLEVRVTSAVAADSRDRIQRSASLQVATTSSTGRTDGSSPMFISAKRPAFQILLEKLRPALNVASRLSGSMYTSVPKPTLEMTV
jgi:hypothetical protein